MEMVWPPYAEKDPSSPSGWRGFDIDLLDAVAAQLGFTYTISKAPALLSGETYTDLLLRTVTETDLWLSWWLRSQERMNSTAMLAGHVDASTVLVSLPPKKQNSAPRFDAFFAPFSYPLWACIGLMIVASGFVDYALEYGYGGSLPSSIYEYFSGVLFGGFQDPHTRLSAFFQICCALIVMIVVSAYTANLAAFLTLSNSPSRGFGSVHDLISSRTAACTVGSYASQATLEAVYSGMSFDVAHTSGGYAAVGNALVHDNCDAAILQKVDFDALLTDGCNCGLSVVGASLFFATAGWVTNLNTSSTLCVQRPIEYALHSLQADSTLDTIFNRYMQPAGCVPSSDPRCTSSTAT